MTMKRTGMSERQYASHAGLSRPAVAKARLMGRLVLHPDGTINAAASDRRRAAMTDPAHAGPTREVPPAAVAAAAETLEEAGVPASSGGGATYASAKTAHEINKAQRSRLELQQKRFSDRLTIELPEAGALPQVWVPSLILQPLVENAVVHGLAGHDGPVRIRVLVDERSDAMQSMVRIAVTNDVAPGRALGREGIGLRNVRERLAVQLGRHARLQAGPMAATPGAGAGKFDQAGGGATWRSEILLPALLELPATARRETGSGVGASAGESAGAHDGAGSGANTGAGVAGAPGR